MTRKNSRRPVLKGLSRSIVCQRSALCQRLDGHKGSHRTTLTAKPSVAKVAAAKQQAPKVAFSPERGVEVLSADRYEVQPDRRPKAATKARRPKAAKVQQCRVRKDEVRCDRPYGHKTFGLRHRFTGRVVVLPAAGPKDRDVQVIKGKASRRDNYVVSGRPSARLA